MSFGAKQELLDVMPPFLTGGEMIDLLAKLMPYGAPVPQKFEAVEHKTLRAAVHWMQH